MSLLPDPKTLGEQLEHARATRQHLDEIIAWLEQGIALLGPMAPASTNGAVALPTPAPEPVPEITAADDPEPEEPPADVEPVEPESDVEPEPPAPEPDPPAPEPRAAVRAAVGPPPAKLGDRDIAARITSALLSCNQPLSRAQLADRAGLTVAQITKPLRAAVTSGAILATGATVSRRYSVAPVESSEQGAKVQAGAERNAEQLTDAVQRIGLRERVLRAVLAQSGELDAAALAAKLEAHEQDVTDAAAWHVERQQVVKGDDGRYWRGPEAARARSPR